VLYFTFSENAGKTVKDESDNRNDWKIKGGVKWAKGKYGTALEFGGKVGDFVEVADSATLNPAKEISYMAWFMSDKYDNTRGIISKYWGPGGQRTYNLRLHHDLAGALSTEVSSNGQFQPGVSVTDVHSEAVLKDGQWHHAAISFKGGDFDAHMVNSSRDWALDFKGDFVKKKYYIRGTFPHTRVAGMQGFVMNQRNEIFLSRKVRAAVAMVFDFQWSNKNLFYGQYTRNECYFDNNPEMKAKGLPNGEVKSILQKLRGKYGSSFVPKTTLTKPVGAPGQGQSLENNIKIANALLDSAGWEMGADGIRSKNGNRMTIKLVLSSPLFQRIVEPYKNNLKKIGLRLDIKVVQIAKYEEILRNFNFR